MQTRTRDGTLKPSITSQREEEEIQSVPRYVKGKQAVANKKSVLAFLNHIDAELDKIEQDHEFIEEFELPPRWIERVLQIPPYRNLKQNMYKPPLQRPVQDEDDLISCSCSLDSGGCNGNCQNRLMYSECLRGYCPCSILQPDGTYSYCENSIIQQRKYPDTIIFETPQCGFGLKANADILPNTVVIEYMGEVLTKSEFQDRISQYSISQHYYFAALDSQYILDANGMGSIARFANHSCEPNCRLQRWYVGSIPHIVLVSQKEITKGEEITYSYGFTHDENFANNPIYHQQCHCGSKYCNGMIGAQSVMGKEIQNMEKKLESILGISDEEKKEEMTESTDIASPLPQLSRKSRSYTKEALLEVIETVELKTTYTSLSTKIPTYVTKIRALLQEYQVLEELYYKYISFFLRNGAKETLCIEKEEVSIKDLQSLSITLQQSICKNDYDRQIQSYLQQFENAQNHLEKLRLMIESSKSVSSHSSSISSNTMYWNDYVQILRNIYNIPWFVSSLNLPKLIILLTPLQQISSWCKLHLVSYYPKQIDEWIANAKSCTNEDYLFLKKFIQSPVMSMELRDAAQSIAQLDTLFGIVNYFDDFISAHMEREDNIQAVTSYGVQNQTHMLETAMDEEEETSSDKKRRKRNKSKLSHRPKDITKKALVNEEDILHCYCQLPDTDTNNHPSDMIECTHCSQWYHAECLNIPRVTTSLAAKDAVGLRISTVKLQDTFYCVECAFTHGALNHYAQYSSFTAVTSPSTSSSTIGDNCSIERFFADWQYTAVKKKEQMKTETPKAMSESHIEKVKPMSSKNAHNSHRGYLLADKLNSCLLSMKDSLLVQYSPVQTLLIMMEKYIHQWEERSIQFLTTHIPTISKHLQQLCSLIVPVPTTATATDHVQNQTTTIDLSAFAPEETLKILQGLVTLAREPFLLHVQHPTTLLFIHCTLWSVCVLPVLYQIVYAWKAYQQITNQLPFSITFVLPPIAENTNKSTRLTLEDLRRCISTGSKLLSLLKTVKMNALSHSIPSTLTKLLSVQLRSVEVITNACQAAWSTLSFCNSPMVMKEKHYFPLFENVQSLINIKKTFVYAKMHSFYYHKTSIDIHKSEIIIQPHETINNVSSVITSGDSSISAPMAVIADVTTSDNSNKAEMYCWCRSSSIEGDMICCDECEEWFHYACVGIPVEKKPRRRSSATKAKNNTRQNVNVVEETVPADNETTPAMSSEGKETIANVTKQGNKKRKKDQIDAQSLEHYYCIGCSMIKNGEYAYAW